MEAPLLGRYRLLVVMVLVAVGLDQGTKAVAVHALGDGEVVSVVGETVDLRLRRNPGIGWSLFDEASEPVRRVALPAIGLTLGVLLLGLYRRLEPDERLLRVGVAAMVGGGLGNLIDRFRAGHVVDFISYRAGVGDGTMSGTFNVADIALVAGVAAVIVGVLWRRSSTTDETPEEGTE